MEMYSSRGHIASFKLVRFFPRFTSGAPANGIELGRVVPDIALARRTRATCSFAQAPDTAHVLGIERFFS